MKAVAEVLDTLSKEASVEGEGGVGVGAVAQTPSVTPECPSCETGRFPSPSPYFGSPIHPSLTLQGNERGLDLIKTVATSDHYQAILDLLYFHRDSYLSGALGDLTQNNDILMAAGRAQGLQHGIRALEQIRFDVVREKREKEEKEDLEAHGAKNQ